MRKKDEEKQDNEREEKEEKEEEKYLLSPTSPINKEQTAKGTRAVHSSANCRHQPAHFFVEAHALLQ
jgi:hypothetical protein